jgi:radical SAM-linked protein
MHRLLYERTGTAVWISHLDMIRGFQRCFARAGIHIKHTAGFNPHAYIAIAMPLSVGTESTCEILDFTLEDDSVTLKELPERLNACFPAGIRVLEAYDSPRKIKELTYLSATITLLYDQGVPENTAEQLRALFAREELFVLKKRKKGDPLPTDIRPMIHSVTVEPMDEKTLELHAIVCAQNPSLNPDYLVQAIRNELPQLAPDFTRIRRNEVLDAEFNPFR